MNIHKVSFTNKDNEQLAGRLELPLDQKPHNFVVFAHCFTCNKNLIAVRNIGRALARAGFGVLRFDFTGLGESEGDFENTNFSGNVEDLIEAAEFLEANYKAPTLIIGHSLGGAAAIYAASKLPSIKAVAVVNSPSRPSHVMHLLKDDTLEINRKGKAKVNLGGIDFTIKKQFLDDIQNKSLDNIVANLRKALLILHSPQDRIVGIQNAEEVYTVAHHPKSFISLDGADHLLSKKEDSQYVGEVIAGWAARYVDIPSPERMSSKSRVAATLAGTDQFTTHLKLGDHIGIADEPVTFGGNNFGPTPYEYISAGLAACTAMTIQMYAHRKKWEVENVKVEIDYSKEHALDCGACEENSSKIDTFSRKISFEGKLTSEQKQKLMVIADKCPVHKTFTSQTQIRSEQIDK